jgi:hypothetical protein
MIQNFIKNVTVLGCVLMLIEPSVLLADCYDTGDCETITCWNASEFDKDGDGYAFVGYHYSENFEKDPDDDGALPDGFADTTARKIFRIDSERAALSYPPPPGVAGYVAEADRMTCPAGWVKARGDCDDDNSEIHPRQFEVPYNDADDNCNGLVDEPSFLYNAAGNKNTSRGFDMGFTLNDQDVIDAIEAPFMNVRVKIEYQDLKDTSVFKKQIKSLKTYTSYWGAYKYAEVRLSHRVALKSNTVYRARVQFEKRSIFAGTDYVDVGDSSDWYYTTTTGSGKLNKTRAKILLKGFHQYYESAHHGIIGYRGSYIKDGMRFDADEGENWCAEFYGWLTQSFIKNMRTYSSVDGLNMRFEANKSLEWNPSDAVLKNSVRPGDYVGIATTKSMPESPTHAAMFLAYDEHLEAIWTLDGNTHGFNESPDIDDRKSRRGANEVGIRVRSKTFRISDTESTPLVKTWGFLKAKYLK